MAGTRRKTWKILRWPEKPRETTTYALACNHCQQDALIEIGPTPGGKIIAAIGLGLIFEPPAYVPPANFMPTEIQCRRCRRIWSSEACTESGSPAPTPAA